MDPVNMIVTALVTGMIAGIEGAASQMVLDGYHKLKELLLQKYGEAGESIEQLEKAPRSKARQAVVEEDLRDAGAGEDEEIVALAQELMHVVEFAVADTPESVTSGPATPEDLVEMAERQAGSQAIGQIVDRHVEQVITVRDQYPVSNFDLLSRNIVTVPTSQLPDQIKKDVGRLQDKVRIIIQEVAARIEERKYKTSEEAIEEMPLAYTDRIRAQELVQADKQIHISYQALKTTVEFFADLNQMIIDKIERAPSAQSETNLVLGNALLVYELTDFLINYIEEFHVRGVDQILQMYEETKSRIDELRRNQENLKERAESDQIESAVREQILRDINTRERSIKLLEQEWENYIDGIDSLQSEVGVIHRKLPTLELIRENAKAQIELIQVVAMLQILKQNIGAMESAILTLEKIRLVSLNPSRVRRLLGIR